MKRAAIYARKSRLTEKGDSIQNQINMCKSHLSFLGIDDIIIYKDEGFSGKNTDRPEFNTMIRDAKTGKFDTLICYKFDRISRNVSDFSNLIDMLNSLSISFISVIEQFDTSTPMGKAMMTICGVFSQLERETISLRVTDNMYALAEKGYWLGGECPTGYKNKRVSYTDSSNKQRTYSILEPISSELDLVKLTFKKYIEFKSLSKLEKYMLANNIKTKRGKDFSKTSLSSILKNPCYVKATTETVSFIKSLGANVFGTPNDLSGILIYKHHKGKDGKLHKINEWIYAISSHPGIIDSPTWIKTQKILSSNRNKAPALGCSHNALLAGLITCAKCNHPMRVAYGTFNPDTNKRRYYYMCTLKHNSGKTRCDARNVNGIDLDSIVIEKLKSLAINKELLLYELKKHNKNLDKISSNNPYKNIEEEIKKNNTSINNILNNLALTTDEDVAKILLKKISALKNDNKSLNEKLISIKTEIDKQSLVISNYHKLLEKLSDIPTFINNCDINEKKQLLSSIIDRIFVNGDTGAVNIKFKHPQ